MTWIAIHETKNRTILINGSRVKKIIIQKKWYDPIRKKKMTKILFVEDEPLASLVTDVEDPLELVTEIVTAMNKGELIIEVNHPEG